MEQQADQKKERAFTSKVIDSQMGKRLGVSDTGVENHKDGANYISPKTDDVESVNLCSNLSAVKKLFQQMRNSSISTMKQCRNVSGGGSGQYAQIWLNIDILAG